MNSLFSSHLQLCCQLVQMVGFDLDSIRRLSISGNRVKPLLVRSNHNNIGLFHRILPFIDEAWGADRAVLYQSMYNILHYMSISFGDFSENFFQNLLTWS